MGVRLLIILWCIIIISVNIHAVRPPKTSATTAVRCRACETLVGGLGPLIRANASTARTTADQQSFAAASIKLCHTNRFDCNTTNGCEQACLDMARQPMDKLVGVVLKFMDPLVVCQFMAECANEHVKASSTQTPITPIRTDISDTTGERYWPAWKRQYTRGRSASHRKEDKDSDKEDADDENDGYFIQMSDIHLDLFYEMGSLARCDQLLCCRSSSNHTHISHTKGTVIDTDLAGFFGHYECDSNIELAASLFRYLSSLDPEPDFILYTGDDPAHDVTQQTRETNLAVINRISSLFIQYLPHIPIFHALGNHDSYPVDQFSGPSDDQWLYNTIASNWHHWLPDEALRTIRFGGFYTARARPGLRVVSLNTNVYIPLNRYLQMNNFSDWSHQLDWLTDVLHQSHRAHERVILIGHAVSTAWDGHVAHRFHKIIEEFQHLIAGQFYGHYHSSSFRVFYDTATNSVPINMAYIGGSITSFKNMNPGYRVYRYDRSLQHQWLVTDAQQYWADLDIANNNHRTLMNVINTGVAMPLSPLSSSSLPSDESRVWSALNDWHVLRWSSRREFGMRVSSPHAWSELISGIDPNRTSIASSHLYQQLYWQYYRGVTQPSFDGRYYALTRTELYCSLGSPTHRAYRQCLDRYHVPHRTPDSIAAPHPRPFTPDDHHD